MFLRHLMRRQLLAMGMWECGKGESFAMCCKVALEVSV
jgi:hypothetical protein